MSFYLLEIGCEELPAAFVPLAVNHFDSEARTQLADLHLPYTTLKCGGTPRRIYMYIDGLPEKQADREDIVQGPPAKIAFNPDGTLSPVGAKFVESKGLELSTVAKVSTDKGEYLTGVKKITGQSSAALIKTLAAGLIRTIPFPKSMRWGARDIRFGRPLKYLMSILNGTILNLDIDGFDAVDTTVGHRFLCPNAMKVFDFHSYTKSLKESFVVLDIEDRKAEISHQLETLAKKGGYEVGHDEDLLDTVVNLVEYPYAIEGTFDELFLELPSPVLITSMKHHQKYFPAYKDGKLQAKFIGISNMKPEDDSLIRQGYERVLRARLNDAHFFYKNDRNTPLEERVEMLKKVVYQEKLGTSYEKMERFRAIADKLIVQFAPDKKDETYEAATLCKADLMCEMVYEFPELQGFMGKVYAKLQGKSEAVANSIEEHYMPRSANDALPKSDIGRVLAIADKLDTIVGAFAIGMIPTGNQDPYGLRRAAIGIINIIEDALWRVDIRTAIAHAATLLKGKATEANIEERVLEFFIQRHKQMLITAGTVDADAYDAAMVDFSDFARQKDRAVALTAAKRSENFKSIAQSYKRINNILKKAESNVTVVDDKIFEHIEEAALYKQYQDKLQTLSVFANEERWAGAIAELVTFAEPLAEYFDKVMVNAPDQNLKNNRLAMLSKLRDLFMKVGDLGEII
ncbi:MAG: glycine--tRNA ligase subunit beta [Deferribacteraceae bacterium]|jgi:glycyl-tRNA synthetase beta chain|nr:glycine--tRNA ligase subunit beta [Deferribacteraceae bacterium]